MRQSDPFNYSYSVLELDNEFYVCSYPGLLLLTAYRLPQRKSLLK